LGAVHARCDSQGKIAGDKIMTIDITRPVKVYRNLKHGKNATPLYSIMQDGRVKARRHQVLLSSVVFLVLESGRQRVIQEKRKNVHAFVLGKLVSAEFTPKGQIAGACGIDEQGPDLPARIHYNPYKHGYFYCDNLVDHEFQVEGAGAVLLNERGMSAAYTY
jgi:hypothetical protein